MHNAWQTEGFSFSKKIASDIKLCGFKKSQYGAFGVLQVNLTCSGPSQSVMRMREIYVAMDCGSSEFNWGFCMLE